MSDGRERVSCEATERGVRTVEQFTSVHVSTRNLTAHLADDAVRLFLETASGALTTGAPS